MTEGQNNESFNASEYYQLINKAEISICRYQLSAAYQAYTSAYKICGSHMNSRYLYNYFVVCAELQKYDTAGVILKELKRREWSKESFDSRVDKIFSGTTAKKLKAIYDNLGTVGSTLDHTMINKVDSIFAVDQATNRQLRSLYGGLLSDEAHALLDWLTRRNITYLTELFSRQPPGDFLLSRMYNVPSNPTRLDIIHMHNAQQANFYVNNTYDSILYAGVLCGIYDPIEFEYFIYSTVNRLPDTMISIHKNVIHIPIYKYEFCICNDSLFNGRQTSLN